MLTIAGGKLTTYRSMAAEMVDQVVEELHRLDGRARVKPPPTDQEPLPGGEAPDMEPFRATGLELGLPADTVDHLLRHYGTESAAICNLVREQRDLMTRLESGHPAIEAEVVHAARREFAQHVDDVLLRRIHLYYETEDHGSGAARRVAELMGPELEWDEARIDAEYERYCRALRNEWGARGEP